MASTNIKTFSKRAETTHPIHDLISQRWSPRAFDTRAVEAEKLHSLFEAARWAASTANKQPWNFVIATQEKAEDHTRLASILNDSNSRWAQQAPVLMLVVAQLYPYAGKERMGFYDTGMAVSNLVVQATELGLVVHQMGGFDAAKARTELNIPEGYEPLAVIALGYPGTLEALPEDLRERELAPRSRKAASEFVFEGKWQQSASTEIKA